MSDYQITLLAGVILMFVGCTRYLRGLLDGRNGFPSLILMLCGFGSLMAAEHYSATGVRMDDIFPAAIELVATVRRALF